MGKLITSSILDSYDWYIKCPPNFKQSALQQIVDALNRKPWDPTPAILRGMAFEKKVCHELDDCSKEEFMSRFEGHSEKVVEFWLKCRGGRQQAKVSKTINIDGIDYYLYGKRDIAFADKTIDIKTTGDYKGPINYITKNQHPMYIMCTGIEAFEYIIAEYDDVKGVCADVFNIDASMPVADAEEKIITKIREFITFLQTDEDLFKSYNTIFCKSW